MKSFEEFKNDEVTISRREFAGMSADVINDIVDGMRLSGEKDIQMRAMFSAMLAVLMEKMFDEANDELEIE